MKGQRIIDHLINQEVTELELLKIYTDFLESEYESGFNKGCDYIRGILRRQKSARQKCVQDRMNNFLIKLDDYLNQE